MDFAATRMMTQALRVAFPTKIHMDVMDIQGDGSIGVEPINEYQKIGYFPTRWPPGLHRTDTTCWTMS